MTDINSKIVKIQRVSTGTHITVPKNISHVLGEAKYAKCTIDETGIHYSPIK